MTIDVTLLSRLQFAFTITAHILFPAVSIGLATFLAIMEGCYLKTKNPLYFSICKFWTKILALTFGMGIVSGIVMEFQFGTNWNGFTYMAGGVLGSLFTYEVLTAFFIEAGFLGVMLFGWNRVGPKMHYFATMLVVCGVIISAFWILSANSWMQTPAGAVLKDGQFIVTSWWHVIFNPSVMPRYFHMLIAAWVTAGFIILGTCAHYLLHNLYLPFAKKCINFILPVLCVLLIVQFFVGDEVGIVVHETQPIKTAAIEGVWHTQAGAPLVLFALPDSKTEKNYWSVSIPHFAAVINTHHWNGVLVGLDTVPKADRPLVPFTFFAFRIMVGLAALMLLVALLGVFLQWRRQLYTSSWYYRVCIASTPLGFLALWFGWITAETGRQPWAIYNILRTEDAVSPVNLAHVAISFALIIIVYGIIFGYFYFKYLFKIIHAGPEQQLKEQNQPFGYMQQRTQGK